MALAVAVCSRAVDVAPLVFRAVIAAAAVVVAIVGVFRLVSFVVALFGVQSSCRSGLTSRPLSLHCASYC